MGSLDKDLKFLRADSHENGTGEVMLTSGAGAKGAWVEIKAATTIEGNWLTPILHDNNTDNDYEVDIGIGGSGSETVLIPDVLYHTSLAGSNIIGTPYFFKVEIPKGTRLSARCKSVLGTDTIMINFILTGTT